MAITFHRINYILWYKALLLVFSGVFVFSACSSDTTSPEPSPPDSTGTPPTRSQITIQSAAAFNFPDPFPARPWVQTNDYKYFYSTKPKIMYCYGPISSNGFVKAAPIHIDNGILKKYINNSGITVYGYWAKSVYKDSFDNWHMVASPRIKKNGQGWNIIVHLKPQDGEVWNPGNPVKKWIVDKVLVGDPLTSHPANYAGKYYKRSDGVLYLIYVKRVPTTSRNAVFAQRMLSAFEVNQNYNLVKLVGPGNYNSEYRNGTSGLKLIETGNMMRINGKYAIVYTVGDYADDNYKIGLAWSDNLLGPYKKVLRKDANNIWGNGAGEREVQYILQAQKSQWPNYIKDQVKAPGVGSINKDSDDKWYLFFAGYQPFAIKRPNGKYNPSKRHPFFVRLKMDIPNKSVANTTNQELQDWVTLYRVK